MPLTPHRGRAVMNLNQLTVDLGMSYHPTWQHWHRHPLPPFWLAPCLPHLSNLVVVVILRYLSLLLHCLNLASLSLHPLWHQPPSYLATAGRPWSLTDSRLHHRHLALARDFSLHPDWLGLDCPILGHLLNLGHALAYFLLNSPHHRSYRPSFGISKETSNTISQQQERDVLTGLINTMRLFISLRWLARYAKLPSNSARSPSTLLFSISIMKDSGPPMRYDEITKSLHRWNRQIVSQSITLLFISLSR